MMRSLSGSAWSDGELSLLVAQPVDSLELQQLTVEQSNGITLPADSTGLAGMTIAFNGAATVAAVAVRRIGVVALLACVTHAVAAARRGQIVKAVVGRGAHRGGARGGQL